MNARYNDATPAAVAQMQKDGWRLDRTFSGPLASGKSRRAQQRVYELTAQGVHATILHTDTEDHVWRRA